MVSHSPYLCQLFSYVVRHRSRFSPVLCNLLQSRVYVLTCGFVRCKALWNLCTVPSLLVQVHQGRRDKSPIVFSPLVGCFHPFNVFDDLVSTSVIQAFFPSCQTNRLSTFADRFRPCGPELFKVHFNNPAIPCNKYSFGANQTRKTDLSCIREKITIRKPISPLPAITIIGPVSSP